jgi:hypothetical protein
MTTPLTATGTLKAWTTSRWTTIDEIMGMIADGNTDRAIRSMSFTTADMSDGLDWCEVGTAEITVTFHPRDTVVAKELDGLKSQLERVRAENHMRENAILDRISKLQAITYTGEAA